MNVKSSTINTVGAVLILLAALPSAGRDIFETGRVHLSSRQFLEELSQRFTGAGRFRLVLQPLIAILLGWRGRLNDARARRQAYPCPISPAPMRRSPVQNP
jgi:hypothetical protein